MEVEHAAGLLMERGDGNVLKQDKITGKMMIKNKESGFSLGEIIWLMAVTITGSLLFAWLGAKLEKSVLFFIVLGAFVGGIAGFLLSKLFWVIYIRTPEYQRKTFTNLIKHYFLTPFLFYLHLNDLIKQPKFRRFALLIYTFIITDEEKLEAILFATAEEMNRLQEEIFPGRKTDWTKLDDAKRDKYMDTLNKMREEKGNIPSEVNAIEIILDKYREDFPIIDEFIPAPVTPEERMRGPMLTFDDLKYVDKRGIQEIISAINVDLDLISRALKAANDDVIKEKFLEFLSKGARTTVESNMRDIPIDVKESLEAQQEILRAANELFKDGDIVIDRADGVEERRI